jgi:EAL domain-containing protein (putative c-di-GMP-specific phosphodiesterase class I)
LPVQEIKIDKSFVLGMELGGRNEAIVRSVIELSHNLGMTVVAEGIEDAATLRRLAELNCDSGQGYLASRPIPAAELERWVLTSPWGAGATGGPQAPRPWDGAAG